MLIIRRAAAEDQLAVLDGGGTTAGLCFAGLAEEVAPDLCALFLLALDGTVITRTRYAM